MIDWQAVSAISSAVLSAIAIWVALRSLRESRRQQQLSSLPVLKVEAPTPVPSINTMDLAVSVTSVGSEPALDVWVEIYPEYDQRQPVPDHPGAMSPAEPVIAGELPVSLPVRVTAMADFNGPQKFRYPWMGVVVRCRSQLGAKVTYVYGWAANDSAASLETPGMGERWILRRVDILLPGEKNPTSYRREGR